MTSFGLRAARALVRGWLWVYSRGLSHDVADARRAEIESDLWESQNDPATSARPLDLVARLLRGVPDDVGWRLEQRAGA